MHFKCKTDCLIRVMCCFWCRITLTPCLEIGNPMGIADKLRHNFLNLSSTVSLPSFYIPSVEIQIACSFEKVMCKSFCDVNKINSWQKLRVFLAYIFILFIKESCALVTKYSIWKQIWCKEMRTDFQRWIGARRGPLRTVFKQPVPEVKHLFLITGSWNSFRKCPE